MKGREGREGSGNVYESVLGASSTLEVISHMSFKCLVGAPTQFAI